MIFSSRCIWSAQISRSHPIATLRTSPLTQCFFIFFYWVSEGKTSKPFAIAFECCTTFWQVSRCQEDNMKYPSILKNISCTGVPSDRVLRTRERSPAASRLPGFSNNSKVHLWLRNGFQSTSTISSNNSYITICIYVFCFFGFYSWRVCALFLSDAKRHPVPFTLKPPFTIHSFGNSQSYSIEMEGGSTRMNKLHPEGHRKRNVKTNTFISWQMGVKEGPFFGTSLAEIPRLVDLTVAFGMNTIPGRAQKKMLSVLQHLWCINNKWVRAGGGRRDDTVLFTCW